jgi:hypothetical protein
MEIFSAIASAVVTTGIQSFFGSSRNTPRVPQLRPGQAPSNRGVPSVEAGAPATPAQAGSTTSIATLINRHEAIMDSIDVSKGVSFSAETTRIA